MVHGLYITLYLGQIKQDPVRYIVILPKLYYLYFAYQKSAIRNFHSGAKEECEWHHPPSLSQTVKLLLTLFPST